MNIAPVAESLVREMILGNSYNTNDFQTSNESNNISSNHPTSENNDTQQQEQAGYNRSNFNDHINSSVEDQLHIWSESTNKASVTLPEIVTSNTNSVKIKPTLVKSELDASICLQSICPIPVVSGPNDNNSYHGGKIK